MPCNDGMEWQGIYLIAGCRHLQPDIVLTTKYYAKVSNLYNSTWLAVSMLTRARPLSSPMPTPTFPSDPAATL